MQEAVALLQQIAQAMASNAGDSEEAKAVLAGLHAKLAALGVQVEIMETTNQDKSRSSTFKLKAQEGEGTQAPPNRKKKVTHA